VTPAPVKIDAMIIVARYGMLRIPEPSAEVFLMAWKKNGI
jgi:hypothetical protein